VLQGAEPVGEHRRVLQRLEPGFGERVVIAHPRTGMRTGDAEIGEQRSDGLGGHRGAAIGVHHSWGAVDGEDLAHHFLRQYGGFA
jgi:hypothetical protein